MKRFNEYVDEVLLETNYLVGGLIMAGIPAALFGLGLILRGVGNYNFKKQNRKIYRELEAARKSDQYLDKLMRAYENLKTPDHLDAIQKHLESKYPKLADTINQLGDYFEPHKPELDYRPLRKPQYPDKYGRYIRAKGTKHEHAHFNDYSYNMFLAFLDNAPPGSLAYQKKIELAVDINPHDKFYASMFRGNPSRLVKIFKGAIQEIEGSFYVNKSVYSDTESSRFPGGIPSSRIELSSN